MQVLRQGRCQSIGLQASASRPAMGPANCDSPVIKAPKLFVLLRSEAIQVERPLGSCGGNVVVAR